MEHYHFQNVQKLVVFSKDGKSVLMCKRQGEADLDGVFTFIGGKMETTDKTLLNGLKREKDEETGPGFQVRVCPHFSTNRIFITKNKSMQILPHYYAEHLKGEIVLNEEYSEYKWVKLEELASFEPKVETIPGVVEELLRLKKVLKEEDFEII